ncbi:hypothetical protein SAY87_029020 [Trapa incisa]|uniref:Polyadenylate-binding protein 1-B-binding protein n=1 Tax=Trapa incisa TaxID=236973 RepID=A0AAN7QQN1_9MYRT|nr:hypothetical protein SAY87_029020 [Trapa incisa]
MEREQEEMHFLAHSWISQALYFRIIGDSINRADTSPYDEAYARLSRSIDSAWTLLVLSKFAYFTFVLLLSLLSTSAVVYTIACIYTGKDVTFMKVMRVVPRVWKRLVVTFLWSFLVFFIYNLFFGGVALAIALFIGSFSSFITAIVILLILYLVGFAYMAMIWQLASVISVLEDNYGRQAVVKSKDLIKGRVRVSVGCFAGLTGLFMAVQVAFELLVVISLVPVGLVSRILIGSAFAVVLMGVVLLGLVVQTVLYLVCKSFHGENINKPALADHLEVYRGDYVPLMAQSIQLGEISA